MRRLLVYNIAYGTGAPSSFSHSLLSAHRYLRPTNRHFARISKFIEKAKADIVGLLEVDTGSVRSAFKNQAEVLANQLRHYPHCSTKYGDGLAGRIVPILRKQGNAILAKSEASRGVFHFFPDGFKRLIIELDAGDFSFFLVHLALARRAREGQLRHLAELLSGRRHPVIVGGDFNVFGGLRELVDFQAALRLSNPNRAHLPTYPSWKPKHQLDFILCSKEIRALDFQVPDVRLSDHLPVILDFKI